MIEQDVADGLPRRHCRVGASRQRGEKLMRQLARAARRVLPLSAGGWKVLAAFLVAEAALCVALNDLDDHPVRSTLLMFTTVGLWLLVLQGRRR